LFEDKKKNFEINSVLCKIKQIMQHVFKNSANFLFSEIYFRSAERTSHLAGLWIGAAISNTPHSNKAGFTIAKRARLTGKGRVVTLSIKKSLLVYT
jgi:hypothetical protein